MTAKSLYKKAKKYYQRKGTPSQFFVSFNPNKDIGNASKFGKIVTQMVDKLGGKLWEVELNLPDAMIAGADVYHGPRNRSVASLVSTYGKNFEQFYSTCKIQPKGVEIMHNMAQMVLDSIKMYKNDIKKLPKQYIFFRDGVGEGQLQEVKKFEIIPWDVPSTVWDNDKKDLKESYNEKEIQLSKENIYLRVRSSEGWELFKKENLSDDKIKYYWRKKIIQN
jgi:hypothetical protein